MSKESQGHASAQIDVDNADLSDSSAGRHSIAREDDVVAALTSGCGLYISLQPQVRLADKQRVGATVCAELVHPRRGHMAPRFYMPAIKRLGLDLLLFYQVAVRAILLQRYFVAGGIQLPVSIRMPVAVLQTPGVPERLELWMQRYKLPGDLLGIELERPAPDQVSGELSSLLRSYQDKGFRILLDGFGFDHPMLKFLATTPGVRVKIDANLITSEHSENCSAWVSMLIRLASALEVGVIADGIQRQEQVDRLRDWQCEIGQGPYFAAAPEMATYLHLANSIKSAA
jgi:diguanylate cyclase